MTDKHLSISVMLGAIFGDSGASSAAIKESKEKVIRDIKITDTELTITFDNDELQIWDNGQSCCEHRYMHTDDDLSYYIGTRFLEAEEKDGPETTSEWGEPKESVFLIITTSKGQFTVVNYNEHNGYYGGFLLAARIIETNDDKN